MNILKARRIKYFLRLTYPLRVIAQEDEFRGDYPDLPGCQLCDDDLRRLYTLLEVRRREWITQRVLSGQPVPLPNSHCSPTGLGPEETTTVDDRETHAGM